MSDTYELIKEPKKRRYIIHVGDEIAKMEYMENPDKTFITHTEVPKALEGQGIGSAMVRLVLSRLEEEGKPVAPLCPFVAGYIKRHPEWKRVVAQGFDVS